jgi:hypothetical protein
MNNIRKNLRDDLKVFTTRLTSLFIFGKQA